MEKHTNPLLCDPITGTCEIPDTLGGAHPKLAGAAASKPLKIIYFTDPICSSCWGIEPQLRKLKLEYGNAVEVEYHMGGLLPDWSYNSGGISKPSDVAHHWDEVSHHYQMPIDGDVWLEDPLSSSYPPSIAFKAAQMQDEQKAITFMRELREMVFLRKKNITKWENISEAATKVGLDANRLQQDYNGQADTLFRDDLKLASKMGVRGFPSIFVTDRQGRSEFIYGTKPYGLYETAIQKLLPVVAKHPYQREWSYLFDHYPTLTTREFATLMDVTMETSEKMLTGLVNEGKLHKLDTKNGPLWRK
ncbi:DsbA family protein [Chitinophaga horti]|uniref:DsbA family protein n=1 Tax=Chitinophaga horti TaxID=2920382 RepID=A0ABY6JAU3_9BACT|nr:ClpXP adapter SpxH family protein [Chitinophaga horti]UYQ95692.1 DsbA family protein [Chitinophaga horti]